MATDPAQTLTLTLQAVGDGTGLVLPEAVLARLGDLAPGDRVHLVATDDGVLLLPPDAHGTPDGDDVREADDLDAATLADARAFMRSHADAFARLAR
jgi:antitoxin component of MazEF toxin-antitoxin module